MATAQLPSEAITIPNSPPSPDGAILVREMARLARRRNALIVAQSTVCALIPAVILAAMGVLAYRFYWLDGAAWMVWALLGIAVIVGVGTGILRRANVFQVAREADSQNQLRDLLPSALAFVQPPSPRNAAAHATTFVPPLVSAAAHRATQISAPKTFPFRFDRPLQVLAGGSLLLGAFVLMPNNDYFLSEQQKSDNKILKIEGEKLERTAKTMQNKPELKNDVRAQINARRLEALAQRMKSGRLTPKKALLGLGELKRDLSKAGGQNSSPTSQTDWQRLREALKNGQYQSQTAQQMQRDLQQNQDKNAADKLDELAKQLENVPQNPTEREKIANDLETAARALRQQKDQQSQNAARQLEQAARELRDGKNPNTQQNQNGQNQQGQQSQNGQNQNSQNQSGQQNSPSQNGQNQSGQNQNGQQNSPNQNGQNQPGQQSQNGNSGNASDAMRRMAAGLRNNSSSGDQAAREMMKRIEEAENNASGQNQSGQQSGQSGQNGQNQPGQNGQQLGQNGQMGQSQGGKNGQGKNGGQNGSGQSGHMGGGSNGGDGRQGVTPGKDLMPSDPTKGVGGGPGLGPRNNIKGAQGKGGGISKQRAQKSDDNRRWGDVWSDRLPATQKKTSQIKGKMGQNGDSERLETRGEARGGAARTPYYDVYESYKRDAQDAIARENVPPSMKAPVKEYFESLDTKN